MSALITVKTKNDDRWDLIADRVWSVPALGWAIAEANPQLAEFLILPAELDVTIPDINSVRKPLRAANPARDGGSFLPLPNL